MKSENLSRAAVGFALLAAALYAVNIPLFKLLLAHVPPTMLAALLYLGAGLGLLVLGGVRRLTGREKASERLTRAELPYTVAMVVLDIAAPIFLMIGLGTATAENASLLNNFEIVATTLIAVVVFKETVSRRLWGAIGLVTFSCLVLSFEDMKSLTFSTGSLYVLLACVCWGFENNCTRNLSSKSTTEIVTIKGIGSGLGSLVIALAVGEAWPAPGDASAALALGFVAYGLSINFYIRAQRDLGAAKTSAFYAVAPFIGVVFSVLVFREMPSASFFAALLIMVAGTWLMVHDTVSQQHTHVHTHTHTHPHAHNSVVHTHPHTHTHTHLHTHDAGAEAAHTHHHADLRDHDHVHGPQGSAL